MAIVKEVTLEVTVPRDGALPEYEPGSYSVTAQLVASGGELVLSVPEPGVPEIHAALLCQLRVEGWTCLGLGRWGRWWFAKKAGE